MSEAVLTLHEAAARLGVHYMTAYRYVRLGLLPAHKDGGTWRVTVANVAAFEERSSAPPPVAATGRRRAPWAARLEDRLIAGDAAGAWSVVEAALAGGAELDEVYLDVLTPAMHAIGGRWERNEIDVADEHRATGIAMRLVGRLGPRFARRGRTRGTVVLANPEGERHALPVALLADLVRAEGFQVSDLGADVPHASLVHSAVSTPDLVAVGLSVSTPELRPAAADAIAALRAAGVTAPLILGGSAIVDLAAGRELGADHVAADGRALVALLHTL